MGQILLLYEPDKQNVPLGHIDGRIEPEGQYDPLGHNKLLYVLGQ
jgi:hypothetical protein